MSSNKKTKPPVVPVKSASVRKLASEKLKPANPEFNKATNNSESLVSSLRQKFNEVSIDNGAREPISANNEPGFKHLKHTLQPTLLATSKPKVPSNRKPTLNLNAKPPIRPKPLPKKSKTPPRDVPRVSNEHVSVSSREVEEEAPPPLPRRRGKEKKQKSEDEEGTPPPLPRRRDRNASNSFHKESLNPVRDMSSDQTSNQRARNGSEIFKDKAIKPSEQTRKRPSPPPPRSKSASVGPSVASADSLAIPNLNISRNSSSSRLSSSSTPPPPPPSRSSGKSTSGVIQQHKWVQPDLDLEIPTCWFASGSSGSIPKCFQGCDWTSSYGNSGNQRFSNYAFRLSDLATVVLKFSWGGDKASPLMTLKQSVNFIPPPTATKDQLLDGYHKFSEHIANWCEVRDNTQVGDGECWTLAHDALKKACGSHAFVSSGLNHGALLLTVKANTSEDEPIIVREAVTDDIRRGDILQFTSCLFKAGGRWQVFGHPDHTAIVLDVSGSKLKIVQQNFQGAKVVGFGEIDLHELSSGDLKVFRPIASGWIVDLSAALK